MLLETPSPDIPVSKGAPVGPSASPAIWNWRPTIEFLAILVQLVLLALLIRRYHLESPAFFQLTLLVFGGFAVHYFLPLAYRLPFFLALSLAGMVLVLGWYPAAWLIGSGVVLIVVCHLPVAFFVRMLILSGVGAMLLAMRGGWLSTPIPTAIWPILGSMFIFRLMVYLYDVRHRMAPVSFTRSLSYFFMLPNVCFPLFPVVDYQSFCLNYYDEDRLRIHQVGVRWIFRGVVHLILYRVLYKNWGINLYEVANAGDLVHYCLWLFLLYLRVSGQFHIIVGMLHLFGFNLAETHHLYYLASSFTDFWRRINIYWKDFMMKLFFNPMFFRLRARGPVTALVLSTLIVFFLTWLLHAVQWFWLRGSFLLAANDVLFWSILAGLVVVNSVWEFKRGRRRTIAGSRMGWGSAIVVGLKTLATFTVICILWSLWTSESVIAWSTLPRFALVTPTAGGWLLIGITVATIVGGATIMARNPAGFPWSRLSFVQESAGRCVAMILLAGLSIGAMNQRLGACGQLIASARSGELNALDMEVLERGYYEDLLDIRSFNGELWNLYSRQPLEWRNHLVSAGYAEPRGNMLPFELKPSIEGTFKGVRFRTNHWGMHDEEYSQKRPANCYRIAVLGASSVMASGVVREEDFETLLEGRLNRENAGKNKSCYELLNFAVGGYEPVSQIWVLQDKAITFEPNAVFYVAHHDDQRRAVYMMAHFHKDVALPDPYLLDLYRRAGVDRDAPASVMLRRLLPFSEELYSWVLRRIVDICKQNDIRPVFILLPVLGTPDDSESDIRLAKAAGFTVLDLTGVFGEHHWDKSLWVAEWDGHPNTTGHRMIADRLYDLLRSNDVIPMPTK